MKVLEHVVEMQIRKSIKTDDIQFVFMPGCGTTDTIFSERQLQKKFLEKKNCTFCLLVWKREKAFDKIPGKKLCCL